MGTVVAGFIDSAEGWAALEAGIAEARRRETSLAVIHSLTGGDRTTTEEYKESAEALDRIRQRLEDEGIEHDVHEYVRGNRPARDLLDAAEQLDAEVLVIGVRRRSATGKILLGSNALEILHDADVPVLCVKASG